MRRGLLWLLLPLLLLEGCAPNAREPDGLALARVLGVDGTEPVTLTAVCGQEDGENGPRGSAAGTDFQEARQGLPWTGEKEIALTSLSYIIVGAGADLERAAQTVLDDHELSPGASVWYAENVGELLEACENPAERMAVLEEQGVKAPTAVQVLARLRVDGRVELPRLVWNGEQMDVEGVFVWEATG